jgi:RNA polymerase primary sigma factor
LLTAEEEIELAYRARQGDQQARNLLVEANMRLVVGIARHYNTSLISFEDIVQEGAIGLMKAVERFDPQRGCRLSTYATPWIRQAISRAIDTKAKAIRVPAHVAESLRRLEKARLQLLTELQEEPTAEQLAERLGMPVVKVRLLLQTAQEPLSLDTLVGEEESTPLLALLNDQDTVDPQEVVIEEERRQQIDSLFSILTPREAEVMRLRLGFEGNCEQMLQKIGETLHLSRERVRQIEILAMKKLKAAARLRALEEYLGT